MHYVIALTLLNFSTILNDATAAYLASVSGLFASFKCGYDACCSGQATPVFRFNRPFSWQTTNFFLGLFSGFSRSLDWKLDNVPEFIQVCHYFMVHERILSDVFRVTFPHDYCNSFAENQLCEVLFALKASRYLFLARNLTIRASQEFENVFIFEDLMSASSVDDFKRSD
ncbi:TPA_asm: hypothetical protein [Stylophora coral adintovirus]|nr:TPA_asm: hypothetical protein [Stylophora coral adintovirus]